MSYHCAAITHQRQAGPRTSALMPVSITPAKDVAVSRRDRPTPRAVERLLTTFGGEPLGGHDQQGDASRPAATDASMTTSR